MFPSEMVILMAIAVTRDSGKKLLARPMDITGEYVGYLYNSLVKRGYIKSKGFRGYQLTPEGKKALIEFLRDNKTTVKETITTLQQLNIEVNQNIDELEKEAIEVS